MSKRATRAAAIAAIMRATYPLVDKEMTCGRCGHLGMLIVAALGPAVCLAGCHRRHEAA